MIELYTMCYNMTMTIESIIKKITDDAILSKTLIPSGLTNDNYHIKTASLDLVVRLPKEANMHMFDYEHEAKILDLIKDLGLDAPLIYYDPKTGIKCSEYIHDAHTLDPDSYLAATRLIAKLHNAHLISGKEFNLKDKFEVYTAQDPIYDLGAYLHYINDAQALKSHLRLCHNDCVEGNFLFTSQKAYMIDYEYALDNDPYFDLMSLITENDIVDPSMRKDIIELYFKLVDIPYNSEKLKVYEGALLVLWCAWACSMYETFNLPIYKEIADLKYQRLTQL